MDHSSNKDNKNSGWTRASLQAHLEEHTGMPAPDSDFLNAAVEGLNNAGVDAQHLVQISTELDQSLQHKLKSKRHNRFTKRYSRISTQLILTIIIVLVIAVLVYGMILMIKK